MASSTPLMFFPPMALNLSELAVVASTLLVFVCFCSNSSNYERVMVVF